MRFPSPLIGGKLIKRYKRFLADVELDTGETVTAACPNTGSMLGLTDPGCRVWLSRSDSPTRKHPHTWELLELPGHGFVGINTGHPNGLVGEAIRDGLFPAFGGYASLRNEVKYGRNSRIDILLEHAERPPCYIEVKNVHLFRRPGLAEFPDCVTIRGAKHLAELADMARQGARAAMVYLVQAQFPERFSLAEDLDPHYVQAFRAAAKAGVETHVLRCAVDTEQIVAAQAIPAIGV